MVIRLIDLTLSVRLRAQHSHPRRLHGKFDVVCADARLHSVDIVEGRLNPEGLVIYLQGETALWHAAEQFQNLSSVKIIPTDETPAFEFTIRRASIEIVGTANDLSTAQRFRANAVLRGSRDVVAFNEIETSGKRRFFLTAPLEVLLQVRDRIQRFAGCDFDPMDE